MEDIFVRLDAVQARLEDELALRLDRETPLDVIMGSVEERVVEEAGLRPAASWYEASYAYYYDHKRSFASKHVRLRVKETQQAEESRRTLIAKWPVQRIGPGREVSLEIIAWLRPDIPAEVAGTFLPDLMPTRVAANQANARFDQLECVLRLLQSRRILRYEIGDAPVYAVFDEVTPLDMLPGDSGLERYLDIEFPLSHFSNSETTMLQRLVGAIQGASGGTPTDGGKVQEKLLRV